MTEKLKAEWPGILRWLIERCLEWQTHGLRPVQSVLAATEAYMVAEDATAAWIDDKCEREVGAWESSADLFGSWSSWATAAGENPGSAKRFAQALESRV